MNKIANVQTDLVVLFFTNENKHGDGILRLQARSSQLAQSDLLMQLYRETRFIYVYFFNILEAFLKRFVVFPLIRVH